MLESGLTVLSVQANSEINVKKGQNTTAEGSLNIILGYLDYTGAKKERGHFHLWCCVLQTRDAVNFKRSMLSTKG